MPIKQAIRRIDTSKQRPNGQFKKGVKPGSGRAKGQRNRTTKLLKEAILEAATLIGQDGRGKGGLVGYLMMLATKERAVYSRLLEKVLPMQIAVQDRTQPQYSAEEAVAKLRERGLPVPPALLALVGPQEDATLAATPLEDEQFDPDRDADEDDRDNR